MRKIIFILLLLFPAICFADTLRSMINPQTGKNDIYEKIRTAPIDPASSCSLGDFAMDGSYFYVCTSTNTWVRTELTTWSVTRTPLEFTGVQLQLSGEDLQL